MGDDPSCSDLFVCIRWVTLCTISMNSERNRYSTKINSTLPRRYLYWKRTRQGSQSMRKRLYHVDCCYQSHRHNSDRCSPRSCAPDLVEANTIKRHEALHRHCCDPDRVRSSFERFRYNCRSIDAGITGSLNRSCQRVFSFLPFLCGTVLLVLCTSPLDRLPLCMAF